MSKVLELGDLKDSLLNKDISLRGGGRMRPDNPDVAVLDAVDKQVKEVWAKVDKVFNVLLEKEDGIGVTEFYRDLFRKLVKGVLRYRRKFGFDKLGFEFNDVIADSQEIMAIFAENGVKVPMRDMDRVLLYHRKEFWEEFFDNPLIDYFSRYKFVVQAAVVNNSFFLDPLSFLEGAKRDFQRLKDDRRFAHYKKRERLLLESIINCPRGEDVVEYLLKREVLKTEILDDLEFVRFASYPSAVERAIRQNPRNPRGFLRKKMQNYRKITVDPKFEEILSMDWLIWRALMEKTSLRDQRAYLVRVMNDVQNLLKGEEFNFLSKRLSWVVYKVVSGYPTRVRERLKEVIEQAAEIMSDPGFDDFDEQTVYFAIIGNGGRDPRNFLKEHGAA